MSKSKQKGTLAETAVANYLRQFWPLVERRALAGVNDKGDISGVPGTVIEVKNQKSYNIKEWLKETEIERINAKASVGVLIVKPNGIGVSDVDKWFAIVPLSTMTKLLKGQDAQGLQS